MYWRYCATPRLPLPCVPCSSGAPKPAPPPPARPTSPTASCAPNASATKCANVPCSIWDGTSMPPKATGRRCAGASRRSSAANCNWHPIARRRSSRTPNTSPPSCSPDTPTSAVPQRRPKDTTFSKSMWTPWSSSVRARSGSSTWDCGRWTSSACARGSRSSASVRRYAPPPSARSSRAWHARAPSAPPGAGSANAARSMSCWESTSRPWSRCSSIAPPMR